MYSLLNNKLMMTFYFLSSFTLANQAHSASVIDDLYLGVGASQNFATGTDYADSDGDSGSYSLDSNFGYSMYLGHDLSFLDNTKNLQGLRVDVEYAYKNFDIDKSTLNSSSTGLTYVTDSGLGGVKTYSGLVNLNYDMPVDWPVTPYVGLGMGLTKVKKQSGLRGFTYEDNTDTVFSWQLKTGLQKQFANKHVVYAGYKYFDSGKAKISSNTPRFTRSFDLDHHAVEIGYRYHF